MKNRTGLGVCRSVNGIGVRMGKTSKKTAPPFKNPAGQRYVNGLTVPRSVAKGRVLHHNHVQHGADTPCGVNGFRAWTCTETLDGFVPCPCKWSGLPHVALREHVKCYRKDGRLKATGEFGEASGRTIGSHSK
jgi:hypothetical protein